MNIKIKGEIRFIGKDTFVDGKESNHVFKIRVIEEKDGCYLAIHCWDEKIDQVKALKLGEEVEIDCRLESHRNKKNGKWFHKILVA